jgi:DNA-directed RNA polymerase subunit RPC12/RpoP
MSPASVETLGREIVGVANSSKEVKMTTTCQGYICDECGKIEISVDESNSLYECNSCGSRFSRNDNGSHKCPDCGKFGSKIGIACEECGAGRVTDFIYMVRWDD